jgi:aspartyl-tRNA synthetase
MIDEPASFEKTAREARQIVFALLDCEKPVIAKVNGHATGLGATIALFCDIVFAADHAKIGDPHVSVGLVAGDGGAVIWPQLIGYARAKEYLMTGKPMTALDAASMGLINHAVPLAELDAQVAQFADTLAGGAIKAINAKGLADLTQGELKALEEIAKSLGAKGLAFIKVEGGEWKSPIVKFFSEAEKAALTAQLEVGEGDMIFFAAAPWEKACAILGRIRLEAAQLLVKRGKMTIRHDDWKFLWVIDFPLMSHDEAENRYVATHHPFTAPVPEDAAYLDSDPKKVRGQHYDVVLNGMELGGGSIRIHNPAMQKKIFEDVLKIPADVVESRFGYMLKAFTYGAPPHGGIAFGLDRMCALLCGTTSIRDVIAFPKTQKGQDLMAQSPTPVTAKQLKELHIATVMPE